MPFNPSRLTLARRRRGITKKRLADAIGVTDRMVSFYEAGTKEPSDETLKRLAAALRFPPPFFSGEDIEEPEPESASFRALSSMTAGERDSAHAAAALAMHLSRWLEKRFILPDPAVPPLRGVGSPETAADILRAQWRIGEQPVGNLIHLLEKHGVRVFALPTDSARVDAFSVWQGDIPFMFLNTSKSAERLRFDAAHELAHLTLHQHGKPSGRIAEIEADRFAGSFLMSKGSVLAHGPRNPSLEVLIAHKRRWGVSAAALAYRLHEVGLATAWSYRSLYIELAKRGADEEPAPMQKEGSQVLAKMLAGLRSEGTSFASIGRDLSLDPDEVSALLFGLAVVPIEGGRTRTAATSRAELQLLKG